MNTTALTLADLTTLIGLIAAIGGLWWRVEAAIGKVREDADRRLNTLAADLAAYKVDVARDYVRVGYLRDVEDRVLKRIGEAVAEIHSLRQEISEAVKAMQRPTKRAG